MIKYIYSEITFAEIPTEISLSISLSNCDGLCEGCHSAELRRDVGFPLKDHIVQMIKDSIGISCVCFLGESGKTPNAKEELKEIILLVRKEFPHLKIGLYSGRTELDESLIPLLDYYKIGPYIASLGPLNSKTTNQRLYKIQNTTELIDITNLFWRSL